MISVRQPTLKIIYILLLCTLTTSNPTNIQIKAKNFGNIKKFVISTTPQLPKKKTDSRKLNMDQDEDYEISEAPSNPTHSLNPQPSQKQTT
jgi:hypothetical protein